MYAMKSCLYSSAILTPDLARFQPDLVDLLHQKNLLVEIRENRFPPQVVIGAPHQAAPGCDRIAENWERRTGEFGRASDENVALTALLIYQCLCEENISTRVVIAAHATDHDPNKEPDCPYFQAVFANPLPKILIEIHGAGENHELDGSAVEVSSGKNFLSQPLRFGKDMSDRGEWWTAVQIEPGKKEAKAFCGGEERSTRLKLPALNTASLIQAGEFGIHAFHLELKPEFRASDIAPIMWQLGRNVAAAARKYLVGMTIS